MESKFELKGLTCANCASKIEHDVSNLETVKSVSMNLVNQTLKVTTFEHEHGIVDDVKAIVNKYEPDVKVFDKSHHEHEHEHDHGHDHEEGNLKKIIIGAIVYFSSIFLSSFTDTSSVITLGLLIIAYFILGLDILLKAIKNISRGQVFDENFLMALSTVGAFIIGEYQEAVGVMLFYQVGEYFQFLAVSKSRQSITSLLDIKPEFATVKRNGELIRVSPEEVLVSEIIIVKPGENIPLDGVVISGNTMIDTKALTGESVPREVFEGDEVLSGCINQNGVISVQVTKPFSESQVVKILDLVENSSSKKAKTENFITIFARYYTPAVVILATLLAIVPPILFNEPFVDWVRRSFVFLVISCPCALVISIPLTFFGGIGASSRRGILIKGGNYLEALYNVNTIVFDKTGTLTKGVFKVTEIIVANGFSKEDILYYSACGEVYSNHPIGKSILEKYEKNIDESILTNYAEIAGQGVSVEVNDKKILVGNDKLMISNNIEFTNSEKVGTKVYVAIDGVFAGLITIADEIKDDSLEAIRLLRKNGVEKIVMLTGDNEKTAKQVAKELEIDEFYYELLPDQKVEKLEEINRNKGKDKKVAFVGDGINDAPVLALADIGISMGGMGQDAAIEASDVVLMTDEPTRIVDALKIAKTTRHIVLQNIIFALGVKGIFLLLGALGYATMWEAVFSDVGVMMIAVLNTTRILKK